MRLRQAIKIWNTSQRYMKWPKPKRFKVVRYPLDMIQKATLVMLHRPHDKRFTEDRTGMVELWRILESQRRKNETVSKLIKVFLAFRR